mmetsp:Transcript_17985/g.34016  ORF Transcript_17985/g.34016 Transcript_17985/m.34016 type:complete len:202 (+) Transcript_17985:791-1396(+)
MRDNHKNLSQPFRKPAPDGPVAFHGLVQETKDACRSTREGNRVLYPGNLMDKRCGVQVQIAAYPVAKGRCIRLVFHQELMEDAPRGGTEVFHDCRHQHGLARHQIGHGSHRGTSKSTRVCFPPFGNRNHVGWRNNESWGVFFFFIIFCSGKKTCQINHFLIKRRRRRRRTGRSFHSIFRGRRRFAVIWIVFVGRGITLHRG